MTATASCAPERDSITGVVLAGGQGSRMGGVDKGLVTWHGVPLALHALQRMQPQVGRACISANRHPEDYARFGVPVLADTLPGYAGPLAGLLAALRHAETPFVAAVPCDVPHFPVDIVAQIAAGLGAAPAAFALSAGAAEDGRIVWRPEPTFCLVHRDLAPSLHTFLHTGGRKAGEWLRAQGARGIRTTAPAGAFANANTAAELQALRP